MTTTKVTIPLTVDLDELWSNVFGSAWETWSWWTLIRYWGETDWNTPGYMTVVSDHPEHKYVAKTFGPDEFVAAVGKVLSESPSIRWDDMDACDGDTIVQTLVFGETIFG